MSRSTNGVVAFPLVKNNGTVYQPVDAPGRL